MDELITVIVPVYNAEKYLDDCIQSIINQTYINLEIVLVNDGSIDNSKQIIDKYSKIDTRITVYNNENMGVSRARNFGIKNSKGNYICFADCDDKLEKNMIKTLYNLIKKENVDLAVCNYKDNKNNKIFSNEIIKLDKSTIYEKLLDVSTFGGFPWNKMYKREIINKIQEFPFEPNIFAYEDLLFVAKYTQFVENAIYIDTPLYDYNIRDTSLSHNNDGIDRTISIIKVYEKLIDIYNKENKFYCNNIKLFYIKMIALYRNNLKYEKRSDKKLLEYEHKAHKYVKDIKEYITFIDKASIFLKFYCKRIYYFLWKMKRR